MFIEFEWWKIFILFVACWGLICYTAFYVIVVGYGRVCIFFVLWLLCCDMRYEMTKFMKKKRWKKERMLHHSSIYTINPQHQQRLFGQVGHLKFVNARPLRNFAGTGLCEGHMYKSSLKELNSGWIQQNQQESFWQVTIFWIKDRRCLPARSSL